MQIELQINKKKEKFFLEYLNSLKDGIIEKIHIKTESSPDFYISTKQEVVKRIKKAEKSGKYKRHDDFWKEIELY